MAPITRTSRVALVALLVAGCGSTPVAELPPPERPEASPALTRPPAGRVVRLAGRPEGVEVLGRGRLAVAVGGRAVAIDARSGRVVQRDLGGPAPGRAVAAAGGRTFVADPRTQRVTVLRDGRVERAFRAPVDPVGVAASRDGRLLAVVGGRERVLALYDPRTGRRLGRATAGVGPTSVVIRGRDAYVTDTRGGALLVFALRPRLELVRRASLRGSPYGIALDAARDRLWVTLTARNELALLPATRLPRIVRHFPTVRQPDGVAVDARSGRVYVTGSAENELQVVDP